jgi:myo-inositol 2-dehydrogenase/D-chiro-inositol 1-dehydrogenase
MNFEIFNGRRQFFMTKITLGIVGAGRIGKLHAENLAVNRKVRIKTISDVQNDSKLVEWASSLGIENVTDDFNEILSDVEIDAILICSPTNTHVPMIIQAAEAGKHIFCEKPISLDYIDSKRALNAAQKANVKLQIGFNRRFDHNFKRVREAVLEGNIGDIHIVKITSRDPSPPPAEYIQGSGGLFMDMAIHDFDMARYLTGSEVVEVSAKGAVLVDPVFGQFGDVDTAIITLKFANGALGVIDNSRKAVYGYDQRVELFGNEGCVSISNDFENSAEWSTSQGVFKDKPKLFFLERYNGAYIDEMNQFVASLLNNQDVLVSGNDGLQAELIAAAAKQSLQENRTVSLSELAAALT